jgi:hypothetical protein
MSIIAKVDWLRVSVPAETPKAKTLLDTLDCTTSENECRPFPWYTASRLITGGGRVDWNEDKPFQGVLYTFTGTDLAAQALRGIFPVALINRFRATPKANFTRLDLALDVFWPEARPSALMDNFRSGEVHTHVQKATSIMGYRKDGEPHGETQYFGSRTGERMLRCYDKAAEQEVDGAWTRLELELKQQQANRAAAALKKTSVGVVASGMMQEFLPFTVDWYQRLMAECHAGNFSEDYVGRHEGDRNTWLLRVAGPAFIQALKDGEAGCWTLLIVAMKDNEGGLYNLLNRRMML